MAPSDGASTSGGPGSRELRFRRFLTTWNWPGFIYTDSFVSTLPLGTLLARLKDRVACDPRYTLDVTGEELMLRFDFRRGRNHKSALVWGRLEPLADGTRVSLRIVVDAWWVIPFTLPVIVVMRPSRAFGWVVAVVLLYLLGLYSTRTEGRDMAGFVRSAASPLRRDP